MHSFLSHIFLIFIQFFSSFFFLSLFHGLAELLSPLDLTQAVCAHGATCVPGSGMSLTSGRPNLWPVAARLWLSAQQTSDKIPFD